MKAIIMAGGEGTRLRPLTADRPKPMVRLFDKPVLEHIVELLKKNDITDICLTLQFMPKVITDYFGDGTAFGVKIQSRIEDEPLGTAGSVRSCADFIGGDDFIVISGDCVCDFDLKSCIDFHKKNNAEATLVLYKHPRPLEYGLVITEDNGRIQKFIEKPPWSRVFTNQINTGIYILSSKVLDEIPQKSVYDFGKDLFPKMLAEDRQIFGTSAEGYWCDIGNCEEYLKCCMEILEGKIQLEFAAHLLRRGIWSGSALDEAEVEITPPVYIGKDVIIEKGAKLGPGAVIGSGSAVGTRSTIDHSVINGAALHGGTSVSGAIIGDRASIGKNTVLHEGCIIGPNTVIGERCIISNRAKIWPGKKIPPESKISDNVITGFLKGRLSFGEDGNISGDFNVEITAETCIALGAAASFWRRIGVAYTGGDAARICASSIAAGVCLAGGEATEFDCSFALGASFTGDYFGMPAMIFVKQDKNAIRINFFGENGMAFTREKERKIEAAFGGDFSRVSGEKAGANKQICGTEQAHALAAARFAKQLAQTPINLTVSVGKGSKENAVLSKALEILGCSITENSKNVPRFAIADGAHYLTAVDENGNQMDEEQILVISALVELENGTEIIAVPCMAPAAVEELAMKFKAEVLRAGRDGKTAEELFLQQPNMRDGIFAAARICAALSKNKEKLSELKARTPDFFSVKREIISDLDRSVMMREITAAYKNASAEFVDGLRINTGHGWLRVSPCADRQALRVYAEGAKAEIAEEICSDFEKKVKKIFGKNKA